MYILFQYSSKINTNNILVSASRTFQIFLTNIKTDIEDKVGHTDCPHLYILRTPLIFLYFSLSLLLFVLLSYLYFQTVHWSDQDLSRKFKQLWTWGQYHSELEGPKSFSSVIYTKTNISGHQKLYKLNTTLYVIDAYKIHFKKQKVQIVVWTYQKAFYLSIKSVFDITFECWIQVNSQFNIAFVYSSKIWGNKYIVNYKCFMEIKEIWTLVCD